MWQIRMSKRRNLKIVFDSRVWSCYDPFHKLLGPIPKTMNGFSTAKYSENVSFDKKIQNLTTLRVMKSLKRLNLLITMILSMCRKGEALSKRKTMRGRQISQKVTLSKVWQMSENVPVLEYVTKTLIPKCKSGFQLQLLQRRMQVAEKLHWSAHERSIAKQLGVSRRTVIRDKRWLEKNIPDFTGNLHQFRFKRSMERIGLKPEVIERLMSTWGNVTSPLNFHYLL